MPPVIPGLVSLIVGPVGLTTGGPQSCKPVKSAAAERPEGAFVIVISIDSSGVHPDSSITVTV